MSRRWDALMLERLISMSLGGLELKRSKRWKSSLPTRAVLTKRSPIQSEWQNNNLTIWLKKSKVIHRTLIVTSEVFVTTYQSQKKRGIRLLCLMISSSRSTKTRSELSKNTKSISRKSSRNVTLNSRIQRGFHFHSRNRSISKVKILTSISNTWRNARKCYRRTKTHMKSHFTRSFFKGSRKSKKK